jgi:hypothetical protein
MRSCVSGTRGWPCRLRARECLVTTPAGTISRWKYIDQRQPALIPAADQGQRGTTWTPVQGHEDPAHGTRTLRSLRFCKGHGAPRLSTKALKSCLRSTVHTLGTNLRRIFSDVLEIVYAVYKELRCIQKSILDPPRRPPIEAFRAIVSHGKDHARGEQPDRRPGCGWVDRAPGARHG